MPSLRRLLPPVRRSRREEEALSRGPARRRGEGGRAPGRGLVPAGARGGRRGGGGGGAGRVRWPCSPSAGARVPSVARPQRRPPGAAGGQGPRRPRRLPARRAATRPGPPSGWPSGLRRCVQVAVSPGGVGSNPTPDTPTFWPAQPTPAYPGLPHTRAPPLAAFLAGPGWRSGLWPPRQTPGPYTHASPPHPLLTPAAARAWRTQPRRLPQRLEPTGNRPSRHSARAPAHSLTHPSHRTPHAGASGLRAPSFLACSPLPPPHTSPPIRGVV